ncbi:DsbA family protein [Paracoccus sp. p4-l81]|uniref:DsbA family protein n=1 Tax=unclassified Paracoccus (in: a-proteobacteria) TaxID=2688777 RepID=UPI0035B9F34F
MKLLPLTLIAALGLTAMPALAQQTTAPATPAATAPAEGILPDMTMGATDAPVEVIQYASFTCSHCAAWEKDIFPRLKMEYIDTGKVKFTHREVYFDKVGLWAGMVARCGGDQKYFPISQMIYDEQAKWIGDGQPTTIADGLRKLGVKAGLTNEQVDACLDDQAMAEKMVATFQATAGKDEINATPTFIINGEKKSNMPWDEFKAILDAEIAKAKG